MASRFGRRVLSQLSRVRVNGQNASRRTMSSSAHGAEAGKSSDMPWIIGSALVFGPLAFYLVSSPAKAKAHDAHEHHQPKTVHTPQTPLPATDDEGTKVPAGEVESSVEAAVSEDSPKDAQAAEEQEAKAESEEEPAPAPESAPAPAPEADAEAAPAATEEPEAAPAEEPQAAASSEPAPEEKPAVEASAEETKEETKTEEK